MTQIKAMNAPASTSPFATSAGRPSHHPAAASLTDTALASSGAAVMEAGVFNVVNVVKTRLQLQAPLSADMSPYQKLKSLTKGPLSGFGFHAASTVIRRGVTFTVQKGSAGYLEGTLQDGPRHRAAIAVFTGMIAGGTEGVLNNSLRRCMILQQVPGSTMSTMGDVVRHVYQREGWQGFGKGTAITVVRNVVSGGVFFGLFEFAKAMPEAATPSERRWRDGVASGAATVSALLASNSFDVVKTHLQVGMGTKVSAWDIAKTLYRESGMRAFQSGLGMNLVRGAPATAFFVVLMRAGEDVLHT